MSQSSNPTPDPTRRDVVKIAGAAGLAAAASTLVDGFPGIQTVKAANDQVQFGMIGTGSRGSYLLKHLAKIDGGRCVAICDVNDDALKKGFETIGTNPAKYKDYRELLSQKNIDSVLVAVPLYLHFPITKDALLAGKHVFCEKSLVFKPEEVHALRALAKEHSKQILQTGLQRRYSKFYQAVRQMIEKGMLGNVTHVHAQWHRNPGWTMKPGGKSNPGNWRLFKDFSGGQTAELASHQIDVADWMFGATPEFVMGLGGNEFIKDGRDIWDNIQLIYNYPGGKKLTYSAISTNSHLPLFNATRTEMGEIIMGTEGTIHITVGEDVHPCTAAWFVEPKTAKEVTSKEKPAAAKAGATMVAGAGSKGMPLWIEGNEPSANDSFVQRELKFARKWLYAKGVMVPEEDKNPVDTELESFFQNCRDGQKPRADIEVGLNDSIAVMLSNIAMEKDRKVYFKEIDTMGKA